MPQAATLLVAQVLQALHDIVAQVGDFTMRLDVLLARLQARLEELAIHTDIFHCPEGSFAEVIADPRHHGFMQGKVCQVRRLPRPLRASEWAEAIGAQSGMICRDDVACQAVVQPRASVCEAHSGFLFAGAKHILQQAM